MLQAKVKPPSHKAIPKTRIKDCPYCKSGLTETEKDFFPCSCSFQACIDCYKDIIHNKGLCPTCHSPLRLEKLNALHASRKEELAKSEVDRPQKKDAAKKTTTVIVSASSTKKTDSTTTVKVTTYTSNDNAKFNLKKMSLPELFKVRILQRNLVYVIGLAPKIAKSEVLDKFEYFGQYGKIQKIIVNKNNTYNTTSINGPSYSAYITFSNEIEASIAILAIDQFDVHERTLRASYGTTKYCTFFLRDQSCPNPDCLYLHRPGNDRDSFIKDESSSNKSVFIDQQKMAIDFLQKHLAEIDKSVNAQKSAKGILPSLSSIRSKVKEHILQNALEKAETVKEPPKTKVEETKSIHKDQEGAKGVSQEKEKIELEDQISIKQEDAKNEESGRGNTTENEDGSNRSSVSRQSTTENENNPKKDAVESQGQMQQIEEDNKKDIETVCNKLFSTYSREDYDKLKTQGLVGLSEINDFDGKVLETLFDTLSIQTESRYKMAHGEDDKEEEDQKAIDPDSEFVNIYKSIQDFVQLPANMTNSTPRKESHPGKFTSEEGFSGLKPEENWTNNESFKLGDIMNARSPYRLMNGSFGGLTPQNITTKPDHSDIGSDNANDLSGSADKKGSNSKTKRGRNKRKKGNKADTNGHSDINNISSLKE